MTAPPPPPPGPSSHAPSPTTVGKGRRRPARTPTVLQMEEAECGAAVLSMVLAHHGRWVPLEELRVACGVSRDGTNAANMVRAARRYGLAAKGFRREPEELRTLPWPAIIHWNFNHFVVFEGFRGDRALLNDPAHGPRSVDRAEFDACFTGIVLVFEPGPEFARAGRRPSPWAGLGGRLRHSLPGLAYVLLAGLGLALTGIVVPVFAKIFVDDVLIGQLGGWLVPLLIGMGVTALLRAALSWLREAHLVRLETKLALAMTGRFLWHVMRLPMDFFNQRHPGDIAARIAANDSIARLLSGELAATAVDLTMIALFGAVMVAYHPGLAAAVIGLGLLNLAVLRVVGRHHEDSNRRRMQELGKLSAATVGMVRSIETIRAGGRDGEAFARWAGLQAKTLAATQSIGLSGAVLGVAPPLLAALATAAVLGLGGLEVMAGAMSIGGLEVMAGAMSIGGLVAFQSLAASFTAPIGRLVGLAGTIQEIKADLARCEDVLAHPVEPRLAAAVPLGAAPRRLSGAVELQGITFGYSPLAPPLIEDFSLRIDPGMRVALVGGSGSGKSTLGRLVCGLARPWAGRVLFDGIAAEHLPPEVVAASVAYVDQEIVLFEGTVRDNLTLWDPSIGEEAIGRALHDAAIHDDIAVRAGRYDCAVAEGGANFSGGQRQRLEIARALAGDPSLLVLDEATAALDPVTERIIDDHLRSRGCACLIIAHRLSTIRDCDEIVVLKRGKVVARGTHEELVAASADYARLVQEG